MFGIIKAFLRWVDIPNIGLSIDRTLWQHLIRDALFAGLYGGFFIVMSAVFNDVFLREYAWLFAVWLQFLFSLGWEGNEGEKSFFGIGDFFMPVVSGTGILLITEGFDLFSLLSVFYNFIGMVIFYVVVVLLLYGANRILGRGFVYLP